MAHGRLSCNRRTDNYVSGKVDFSDFTEDFNKSKEKGEKGSRVSVSFNFIQLTDDGKIT